MIEVRSKDINEFELMIVLERLKERGTTSASIYSGNDCVWVASGSASVPINEYFIFRDGKLVDVQID